MLVVIVEDGILSQTSADRLAIHWLMCRTIHYHTSIFIHFTKKNYSSPSIT